MVDADMRGDVPAVPGHAQMERQEHDQCEEILAEMGVDFVASITVLEFFIKNHTFRAQFINKWSHQQRWQFICHRFNISPPPATAPDSNF